MRKIYHTFVLLAAALLIAGVAHAQPSISYAPVTPSCAGSNVFVNGVSITDAVGVPTAGASVPRIYFRKGTALWSSAPGILVSGDGLTGTWDFTINTGVLGGVTAGNTLSYFIIAENTSAQVAATPGAGLVATGVNAISTFPTAPNSYLVSPKPSIVSLSSTTPTPCVGVPFTLTASGVSGTGTLISYNWSGPSGFTATGTTTTQSVTPVTTLWSGLYSVTVTYPGDGCESPTRIVSVSVSDPLPAVAGASNVCVGSATAMAIPASGGSWSSSNTSVATVNFSSGLVTGISTGVVNISYVKGSCFSIKTITVNATPSTIVGDPQLCVGSTTTITNADAGGAWSSSNPAIASIDAVGLVTGITSGTVYFTYAFSTGCRAIHPMIVNVVPSAIAGTTVVCEGSTVDLSVTPTGGVWVSSNPSVGTVGAASGVVYGVSTGTTTISYVVGSTPGCVSTVNVTVNARPAAIAGSGSLCLGSTTTLSNVTSGGTWSSSNTTIATVDASGLVFGVSASNTTISYTLSNGCSSLLVVTVNNTPGTISGSPIICKGSNITYSSFPYSGTWSSSNAVVAPISSTGITTGAELGTAVITNSLANGCSRSITVTVTASPALIGGTPSVCTGNTTTLLNDTLGGTWSTSTSSTILSVDAVTGVVTGGISAGSAPVTYTLSNGCFKTVQVTVNTNPATITGAGTVCIGVSSSLANAVPGGTWTSSNPAVATISSGTGLITGLSVGTTNITYATAVGCFASRTITVNPSPSPIVGSFNICAGSSTPLTSVTTGGSWYTSASSIASVNISTGVLAGVSAGTAEISYRLPTGCLVTQEVTINPLPSAIAGSTAVCIGTSSLLSSATPGGTWSISNPAVGTIDAISGNLTALTLGTAVVYYTSTAGCISSKIMTANANPATIDGSSVVCTGATIALTSASVGGVWTSSSTANAIVNSTGFVNGIAVGGVVITYRLPNTCFTTKALTVEATPDPITGSNFTCVGATSTLASTTPLGVWSTSNATVATVDASGVVTGVNNGVATISYTIASGCRATTQFTVNVTPTSITGVPVVCEGFTTTLGSLPTGGTWNSSNPLVASVSTSGVVSGINDGNATISYSLANGCTKTVLVTVNETPAANIGTPSTCVGATTTLSNTILGGTWTSANVSIATVGATTGIVTGVTGSNVNITYTLPTGCRAITNVVVNPIPGSITGSMSICEGGSTNLANGTSGGSWISTNTAVATIGSSSGIAAGVAFGTSTISYVLPTGCQTTRTITVNAIPAPITGATDVCVGATTTLSNTTAAGTWSSSNTSVANIGIYTGVVTGVSGGVATITYRLSTSCFVTRSITVNVLPAAITGTTTACVGTTTVFASSTAGGIWSSSDNTIAQVGTSGIVTGFGSGAAVITYALPTSCFVTRNVTIFPAPAPIAGTLAICQGTTSNLTCLTPGGTWSSSSTTVATVGISTGIVTGVFPGTSIITYTTTSGCRSTAIVTINGTPSGISGIVNVCLGSTSTLSSLSAGGVWTSGNPVVATVDAAGVVTGVTTGVAPITYTLGTGCRAIQNVTVNNVPANILGIANICQAATTNLTNATGGGSWSSSDNSIATVGTLGIVSGVFPGTATISYTLPSGCFKTREVTVNAVPDAITGGAEICVGSSDTLTSTTAGGIWTSGAPSIANIGVSTGLITGVSAGTSVITYTVPSGCRTFVVATVYAIPSTITGVTNLCSGSSVTLANAVAGGTWSTDNPGAATVAPGTGVVTGTGPGLVNISYTLPGGCATSIVVTVTPAPPPISGDLSLCAGETSLLTNPVTGGGWTSSNPSVATIDLGSGLVTSHTPGSSTITYTLGVGCRITTTVNVAPAPSPITGPAEVCMGHTVTLYNAVAGGTWISSDVSVASVESTTGVVTGIANNTVDIRYQLPGGCVAIFPMTVNATPNLIGGPDSVCQGSTTLLTNSVAGGIWTSSDASIAPVDLLSGVVSGVSVGTATVSYTILGSGCYRTVVVSVNPNPDVITGSTNVCVGAATILASSTVGGIWTSSDLTVAAIGSGTGIVTGLSSGTATMTYTLPTGCYTSALVVVNPLPAPIVGFTEICVGSATTMTNSTPFGTWSASNANVSINATTGVVTGITAGTSTITYQLLTTGCFVTQQLTINPLPPSISGLANLCIGSTSSLFNVASGGTWSSSNPAVATIDAFGNLSSVALGSTTITYTLGSACYVTRTVNIEPTLNPITGVTNVCEFASIVLANDYSGGVWTSGDITKATVGTTGIVTGVAAGTVLITYATPLANCSVTKALTVDPVPSAIVGADSVCEGSNTTFVNSTAGGTWSSSNITVATVGSSTGVVVGIAPATALISYTVPNGCSATKEIFVKALANSGIIGGPSSVCLATNVTLVTSGDADGVWSSSNASVASVGTSGIVNGVAVGTAVISYIVTNTCSADTATYGMLVKPDADAGILSGNSAICLGYTSAMSSTVAGGVWTSSDTEVASIDVFGVVTGLSSGTATISYAVTTDCGTDYATRIVTVNVLAPNTVISVHPDTVICANSLYVNFGAAVAPGSGISYIWSADNAEIFATSSPDKQNAIVNFTTPGYAVIRIKTQIDATSCFVVDSFTLRVKSDSATRPEVKYYASELICMDNIAEKYQWGYDDAFTLDSTMIPGATSQAYYLPVPDFTNKRYWVIVTNGGCSAKVYYNAPTDVAGPELSGVNVNLFPNPTDARINIQVSGAGIGNTLSVKIVDMLGKEVEVADLKDGKGLIDVSNLASGLYSVVVLENGVKVASKTFVKN